VKIGAFVFEIDSFVVGSSGFTGDVQWLVQITKEVGQKLEAVLLHFGRTVGGRMEQHGVVDDGINDAALARWTDEILWFEALGGRVIRHCQEIITTLGSDMHTLSTYH
jgi:hypothetical protein